MLYNKKPILVNMYAGPGSGKSTLCAATFAELKWMGVNCEMALEYVKDKVWEESFKMMDNQVYITSKQQHRLFRLRDKVDVILTDSPLLMGTIYDSENNIYLKNLILQEMDKYDCVNIFIKRLKKYNPKGRMQTLDEAKGLDGDIKMLLDDNNILYHEVDGIKASVSLIVNYVMDRLNNPIHKYGGKAVVISGVSASGKTSLAEAIIKDNIYLQKLITTTTRKPRHGEVDGVHYKFKSFDGFSELINSDKLLEWEEVYDGCYYGSEIDSLQTMWEEGKLPIIVCDVKGALNIKEKLGDDCIDLYIDIDKDTARERLNLRGSTEDDIEKRMNRIDIESKLSSKFSHVVSGKYRLDELVNQTSQIIEDSI